MIRIINLSYKDPEWYAELLFDEQKFILCGLNQWFENMSVFVKKKSE